MISSDMEWKARIYGILRKNLGVSRVSGKQVSGEIAGLIRQNREEQIFLAEMCLLQKEECDEDECWKQAEKRLTRLLFRIAVVQLLAIFLAVLLLKV